MGVGHAVEHLSTLPPSSNQTGEAELTKLMTRRRLAEPRQIGEFAHTELAGVEEGVDHAHPPGVGEELEPIRQNLSVFRVQRTARGPMGFGGCRDLGHTTNCTDI